MAILLALAPQAIHILPMSNATTWTERAIAAVKTEIEYRADAADLWDPNGPGAHMMRSSSNARYERQRRNRWENVLTRLRVRSARLAMR